MRSGRVRTANRSSVLRQPGSTRTRSATALLHAWRRGNVHARDKLMRMVYGELRRRAAAYLRRERVDHTLQPTALVHEAYLRLIDQNRIVWQNRAHFFAVAAQVMRRILVDHARGHGRRKRSGAALRVTLDERVAAAAPAGDLLQIDQALAELAAIDPRQSQIVELRYFGGLTESEVAEVLNLSRSTVTREWQTARAWLYRWITSGQRRPGYR